MSPETQTHRHAVVMNVRCPDRLPESTYRQVLEELADLSPVVQALPPTAALVDLTGALRYHGTTPHRLGEVLRIRTISRLGVDVRVGIGPSITVAATASAQVPPPGGVLTIAPDQTADWLAQLPVDALHGIGPRQAATLRDYGIHTVARPPTATAPHLSRPPPCRLASHANPRRKPRARWQGGTPADRRLPGSTTIRRTSSTSCPSGRERGSVSTGPSRTDLPLPGTAARRPSPARCAVRRIKLRGRGVAPLAHRSGLTVVVVVSAPRAAARGRVLRSGGPALGDPGQAGGEVAGFPTGNAGSGSHRTGGPQRRQRHDPSRRHPGVA
jgi:hypothetical protein